MQKRRGGFSSRSLARAIFAAEMPEQFVRTIPPQSLFMAVKQNGLAASSDLIEIATLEQCRLMLDFDCWEGDRFAEERFWEWLSLTDDDNGLKLLQKLLRFVDLKLIGLLISRHVEVRVFEEPTDNPPGPGFYTPDKGHTWLGIHTADADQHFLLARLLALIFETEAELFYQIINIPNVSTEALLEEESFQERTKRLAAEGVPDAAWAHKITAPMSFESFAKLLGDKTATPVTDIAVIEPIIYESLALQPLASFLDAHTDRDVAEMEITLIANAAIVRWDADFGDQNGVMSLIERVKGAMNIGLECALERHPEIDSATLAKRVGLQPLFQLGLTVLFELRKLALKTQNIAAPAGIDQSYMEILREAMSRSFPQAPLFLDRRGNLDVSLSGEVTTTFRAFEHLSEVNGVRRIFS